MCESDACLEPEVYDFWMVGEDVYRKDESYWQLDSGICQKISKAEPPILVDMSIGSNRVDEMLNQEIMEKKSKTKRLWKQFENICLVLPKVLIQLEMAGSVASVCVGSPLEE